MDFGGLKTYMLERSLEPSTWSGLGIFLTAVGWTISPEAWQAVSFVGMGVGGLAAIFLKERT